jgi:hypothetical protein
MAAKVARTPWYFDSLPLEVRNAIYHALLCNPPPAKLRRVEQADILWSAEELSVITHPSETQILRVNSTIRDEAKDVMLRGNQFVRIQARGLGPIIEGLLRGRQIPIVRTGTRLMSLFKGYVMTHSIELASGRPPRWLEVIAAHSDVGADLDVVILRRDLGAFCASLANEGFKVVSGFGTLAKHNITIHNPFQSTPSSGFPPSEKHQERLLQPYRDHLRGFLHFSVGGDVSSSLAESVKGAVAQEDVPEPQDLAAMFKRHKDLGNRYYSQKEFRKAAEAYAIGYMKVTVVRNGNHWSELEAKGGETFLHSLAETYFHVCLDCAQNILAFLGEIPDPNQATRRYYCGRADFQVRSAGSAGQSFGTDWRPSLEQMARLTFRAATVERAMGHLEVAQSLMEVAREQAPSDPAIISEAEELDALIQAQTGLVVLLI